MVRMQFEEGCPFTEEEMQELHELANAPLDYELKVIQEEQIYIFTEDDEDYEF